MVPTLIRLVSHAFRLIRKLSYVASLFAGFPKTCPVHLQLEVAYKGRISLRYFDTRTKRPAILCYTLYATAVSIKDPKKSRTVQVRVGVVLSCRAGLRIREEAETIRNLIGQVSENNFAFK
jgi:hypothetical protein